MAKQPNYDGEFFNAGRQYFERGLGAWKDFVLNDLKAQSIADFGCGQGDWLEPLQGIIPVWGCDGYADKAHLRIDAANFADLDMSRLQPHQVPCGHRDVVMSLEAMEHVAHEHEGNFFSCMLQPQPRIVVLGVASGWGVYDPTLTKENRLGELILGGPNWHAQFGRHHVNCQPIDVVVAKMKHRGYIVNDVLSDKFRNLRVPGKTKVGRFAFAGFYRKNTRVYERV